MSKLAARLALGLLLVCGCSRTITGPSPAVTGTTNPLQPSRVPAALCNAQGATANGWTLQLHGSGFAPLPVNVLAGTKAVEMPVVTLSGATSYELPRDRVTFVSSSELTALMPTSDTVPAQSLAAGSYTVEVKNPNGHTGSLADALLVVDAPTLSAADASGFSTTAETPVVLTGTGFRPGELPAVQISGTGGTIDLTSVTVVSATEVDAMIPAGTAAGTYSVTLTNPEGCSATLPNGLVLSDLRLGALTLDPRFGWQLHNTNITIYNAPTGNEVAFSGGAPEAFIVAPLKGGGSAVQIPLRREAFLSAGVITAVVPTCSGMASTPVTDATCANGIQPGGPYEIKVRDPSGAIGSIPAANGFYVLDTQPPEITSIQPSAIDTNGLSSGNPLTITGTHFGANAIPQIVTQLATGNLLVCNLPPVDQTGETQLRAAVPTSIASTACTEYDSRGQVVTPTSAGFQIAQALYVIRVQRTTDVAFADYSALGVRNPSANPAPGPAINVKLAGARADFPLVEATDDLGRHYLYALGGTDGSGATSTVQAAQISPFGNLGGDCSSGTCLFRVLDRTPMGISADEPRRGHTAVSYAVAGDTSYLYVMGGINSSGAALATVERAQVLRTLDAPALDEPTRAAGGNLGAGTYYYEVSAIRADADAKNPGGETLASDQQGVTTTSSSKTLKLSWPCQVGVKGYRIYRTAEVNAVSGTEVLLEQVSPSVADCAGSPANETYTDDGHLTPGTDKPLPPGAIGHWAAQGTLTVERGQAAAYRLGDTLYVAGGFCSTVGANCTTANGDLRSVERAAFGSGTPDLGSFSAAGNLNTGRRKLSLALANASTAPSSFTTTGATPNVGDSWLIAVGGSSAGAPLTSNIYEVSKVVEDDAEVASPAWAYAAYTGDALIGGWARVLANYMVQAGPNNTGNFAFRSGQVCPGTPPTNPGQCTGSGSFDATLPATGIGGYAAGGVRYLSGSELFRAYVYVAGGFPTLTETTPTDSIERLTY